MLSVSVAEQATINGLNANWVWVPNWVDSARENTAGRIVSFVRYLTLATAPTQSIIHFTADTRYKLYVNGKRIAVGPARCGPTIWFYDQLDIAQHLRVGENEIKFVVLRYFASSRGAMPFERTIYPGLTVYGCVNAGSTEIDLTSRQGWIAQVDDSVQFPTGIIDDGFLHINERIFSTSVCPQEKPKAYNFKTLNGDILPWRLRPRAIPMPEESIVAVHTVRTCESSIPENNWTTFLSSGAPLRLPPASRHIVELQAAVHSTAFLRWSVKAIKSSQIKLKVTYSEGYELEPRQYPYFRTKSDRLNAKDGHLIGPFDEVTLEILEGQTINYEPFWFRTFRLMRLEIEVGREPVEILTFSATQVNYPMAVKASWQEPGDAYSARIWDVSIRTMRNCMFDGYSDCPFYEQLQYSCDSRSVGLFHYLLSGDDRLMRQGITLFASSVTFEGLTQSRFPSHVNQIIAGFPLYWILQVCDHHLFFGDTAFARTFLPRIDGVLDFFDAHVGKLGLVSDLPEDVWQYVDWVTSWGATDTHPDKGVPVSGRKNNLHTYFSLLYAYVLVQAATLVRDVGRPAHATEYEERAAALTRAVRTHCYDGQFFTDSTADVADELAYSQHCQVFAVLSGAAEPGDHTRLLQESFAQPRFSKCSYMMKFYALRALAKAGDEIYESSWNETWKPWRRMLDNNLSTWEEDDVRQRSDCHAWGSVPIYEYCTELAGIRPISPGSKKILFKPRLGLSEAIEAKIALGGDNLVAVSWQTDEKGRKHVKLHLCRPIEVVSQLPGQDRVGHGVVDELTFVC